MLRAKQAAVCLQLSQYGKATFKVLETTLSGPWPVMKGRYPVSVILYTVMTV
jgi:hypothetical protein